MPIETVTLTVTGANPQTKQVQVTVDPLTGIGSGSFNYTGSNGGTDNVVATATIAGNPLTSNSAQVNWQQSNGSIQVGDKVVVSMWDDSPHGGPVASYTKFNSNDPAFSGAANTAILSTAGAGFIGTATGNSLVFDPGGVGPSAVTWVTLNASGAPAGSQIIFPSVTENFNMVIEAFLVVPAAGSYSLSMLHKDGTQWGIGGAATWLGKGTITGNLGQTMTAKNGYPLLPSPPMSGGGGGITATDSPVVTFAAPGIYALEGNWDYWDHSGRTFAITANGGTIAPIPLATAPPSAAVSGNLQVTPSGGATNLLIQGQAVTLTLGVSGITFQSVPYIPLLEGVSGQVFLYNDPTLAALNLPIFNGVSVPPAVAAASPGGIFSLSGDNGVWQGLLSIAYQSGQFVLMYNGGAFNLGGQASTELTVTADDISWYSTAKGLDVFQASAQGGGSSAQIQVNYLVSPTIASVVPSTIAADGATHQFTLFLNKSLAPLQGGYTLTISGTNGITIGTPTAVNDANGWVAGWTFAATIPHLTSTTAASFSVTLVGNNTTYLSGTGFTTGSVTYINAAAVALSLTGTGTASSNPTYYTGSVSVSGTSVTIRATIRASSNSFGSAQFQQATYLDTSAPGALIAFGAPASPTNIRQISTLWYADYTVNGPISNLGQKVGTATWVVQVGLTEAQTDGAAVTYRDTTVYS